MDIAAEARTERRLAAVLAADVVGYSRLMGKDEEGTLFAFKAVRCEVTDPKIHEHRGRIVKTTGDGLLVEFASVVDAVRCAVDIQRAMKLRQELEPVEDPICLRIGVNVADIIPDDADIFGDGVNVAARLEGLADPGGICVSRSVRDQVRDKLGCGFEDLGRRQVKNIARPVHVFRIPLDTAGTSAAGADSNTAATPSRRGIRLVAAMGIAAAAVVAAGVVGSQMLPGTGAAPAAPVVEAAVFFDKNQVGLSEAASASIRREAEFAAAQPRRHSHGAGILLHRPKRARGAESSRRAARQPGPRHAQGSRGRRRPDQGRERMPSRRPQSRRCQRNQRAAEPARPFDPRLNAAALSPNSSLV